MITCTRRLKFDAGHRVMGHEGLCSSLHGHEYKVLVTARASALDSLGRVVDFSVLKQKVGGWIDRCWDHAFIVNQQDHELIAFLNTFQIGGGQTSRYFILPNNPTAENLANHLMMHVCPEVLDSTGVVVTNVRVWETENCYADATLE